MEPAERRNRAGRASRDVNSERNSIEVGSETCPLEAGEQLPPSPLKGGSVDTLEPVDQWARVLCVLKSDLASTACSTRFTDDYDQYFRDSWQVGFTNKRLVVMAEEPEIFKAGLRKYAKRIKGILRNLFGSTVTGVDLITVQDALEGEVTHA